MPKMKSAKKVNFNPEEFACKIAVLNSSLENQNKVKFEGVVNYESHPDEENPSLTIHRFSVPAENWASNILNDPRYNRAFAKLSKFARDLKEAIAKGETSLSLNHSGVALSTESKVRFSKNDSTIETEDLVFSRDGGTTNKILLELMLEGRLPKNRYFVKVEIVEGKMSKQQSALFTVARNNKQSFQTKSALNIKGGFSKYKAVLDKAPYGSRVSYQEGDDLRKGSIDIVDIIIMQGICNGERFGEDTPPNKIQLMKKQTLRAFEKDSTIFEQMLPITLDIIDMSEEMIDIAIESLPKRLSAKYNRFAKKRLRGKAVSRFTGKQRLMVVHGLSIAPIISSLRVFNHVRNGESQWRGGWSKKNIMDIYRKIMPSLISTIISWDASKASTPDQIAKNKELWNAIYNKVQTAFLKNK